MSNNSYNNNYSNNRNNNYNNGNNQVKAKKGMREITYINGDVVTPYGVSGWFVDKYAGLIKVSGFHLKDEKKNIVQVEKDGRLITLHVYVFTVFYRKTGAEVVEFALYNPVTKTAVLKKTGISISVFKNYCGFVFNRKK